MSLRQIAQRIDHHHSTVSRIANKHRFARDQEVPYYILKRGQCPRTPSQTKSFRQQNCFERTVVAPSVAICKNSPKSSEICCLSFKKTCKEMFTNTSTQSFPFAIVSKEFGLVEESSLVRRKSFLVARDRWQSACMATTEHCLC